MPNLNDFLNTSDRPNDGIPAFNNASQGISTTTSPKTPTKHRLNTVLTYSLTKK